MLHPQLRGCTELAEGHKLVINYLSIFFFKFGCYNSTCATTAMGYKRSLAEESKLTKYDAVYFTLSFL